MDYEAALVHNLRDVKRVLDTAGVEFWLDYGTLLGATRENRILQWEREFDLGIWNHSWNSILGVIPQLLAMGFYVALTEAPVHETICIRFLWLRRFGINADISVYDTDERQNAVAFGIADGADGRPNTLIRIFRWSHLLLTDSIYFAIGRFDAEHVLLDHVFRVAARALQIIPSHRRKKLANTFWRLRPLLGIRISRSVIPLRFFKKLKTVRFYGLEFRAPADLDEYLSLHYGDWRVPKQHWDWIHDDGAIDAYF